MGKCKTNYTNKHFLMHINLRKESAIESITFTVGLHVSILLNLNDKLFHLHMYVHMSVCMHVRTTTRVLCAVSSQLTAKRQRHTIVLVLHPPTSPAPTILRVCDFYSYLKAKKEIA